MINSSFINIQDLSHQFTKDAQLAINALNLSLNSSQMIGIVGPDGAGKTTLLRILAGLLKPTSGKCIVDGVEVSSDQKIPDDLIRYMPQKFGLYEDLTVIENLNLYADLNCLSSEEKKIQKEKLLKFTNLQEFQSRLASDLSGGMKQKLGLACSLLKKSKLLILDEPTVGVDPISRKELWQMIDELLKSEITVVCSTSYLDEVEKFQTVIIINEGKILFQGTPQTIKNSILDRTFQLKDLKEPKRNVLSDLLINPHVLDGIIQGDALRILAKKNEELACKEILNKLGSVSSTGSNFEDAYLDFIPQPPQRKSPIYELYPTFVVDSSASIQALNLSKNFGNFQAVDDISFSVKQGEIFGLLGPNGAGKSTTFKMLCGLLKPSKGESLIKNISLLNAPSEARSKIGYMAQKFSLYSNMTVLQNLNFFYGIYPAYKQENHAVDEMIETFFLQPFLNSLTKDLPLGFKQRLALACSIMHRPEVLFLDEPTSGVDPVTRREFWSHINALVSKNVAIIVTTHFMDEAEYCDRIGLVNNGKIVALGTPDEIKNLAKAESNPNPSLEEAFILISSKGKYK